MAQSTGHGAWKAHFGGFILASTDQLIIPVRQVRGLGGLGIIEDERLLDCKIMRQETERRELCRNIGRGGAGSLPHIQNTKNNAAGAAPRPPRY